ncbi:MAG: fatty acid desaturase [Gammaproteobacteria bacterium]
MKRPATTLPLADHSSVGVTAGRIYRYISASLVRYLAYPYIGGYIILALIFQWQTIVDALSPLLIAKVLLVTFLYATVMTVFLHRFFSHKAFYARNRVIQFIFCWIACAIGQKGALWWASIHRRHHASFVHGNTEDPHPAYSWWYCVIGCWSVGKETRVRDDKRIKDFLCYKELDLLDRHSYLPILVHYCSVFILLNPESAFFYVLVPAMVSAFGTAVFNHDFHDKKTNEPVDMNRLGYNSIFAFPLGENNHLDHHVHPKKIKRHRYDFGYVIIKLMEFSGLIYTQRRKASD